MFVADLAKKIGISSRKVESNIQKIRYATAARVTQKGTLGRDR